MSTISSSKNRSKLMSLVQLVVLLMERPRTVDELSLALGIRDNNIVRGYLRAFHEEGIVYVADKDEITRRKKWLLQSTVCGKEDVVPATFRINPDKCYRNIELFAYIIMLLMKKPRTSGELVDVAEAVEETVYNYLKLLYFNGVVYIGGEVKTGSRLGLAPTAWCLQKSPFATADTISNHVQRKLFEKRIIYLQSLHGSGLILAQ